MTDQKVSTIFNKNRDYHPLRSFSVSWRDQNRYEVEEDQVEVTQIDKRSINYSPSEVDLEISGD